MNKIKAPLHAYYYTIFGVSIPVMARSHETSVLIAMALITRPIRFTVRYTNVTAKRVALGIFNNYN